MFPRRTVAALLSLLLPMVLGGGLLLCARFIEPHWIEETRVHLTTTSWQGRPLTIAVLADLHAKPGDGKYLDDIVRRTLALQPDLLLLLGDYVNDPDTGPSMDPETLGRHLSPFLQLPSAAVLGNHDHSYGAQRIRDMLESIGATVLEDSTTSLDIGGDTLHLGGIHCLFYFDNPKKLRFRVGANDTLLTFAHSPTGACGAPKGTALALGAHTHGGQVCLPGGGSPLKWHKRWPWGTMRGETLMKGQRTYITRGLGTSKVEMRLWCRPELLVVELKGGRGAGK